jgi:2',3'-cyclic-nucleotide 2'-phosphodiesterase (5'-nucleotidase family)
MSKKYLQVLLLPLYLLTVLSCTRDADSPVLMPGDTLTVAIMTTTDLHGWVLPFDYASDRPDERYGLAKVATLVDSVRNVHPVTLLLDAGDFIQGNQFAEYFARVETDSPTYPLFRAMEFMDFDVTVVGNHEFNFGMDYLNMRVQQTSIPVLGGNVYQHGTDNPHFEPYILIERAGVRFGIVGLTTPGSAVWDRPRVEGIVDFGDGLIAAQRFVKEVREKGAEFVIVLQHASVESSSSFNMPGIPPENFGRAVAETVEGIDLIITAHSHRVVDDLILTGPGNKQVPFVQAGRWGSHLGIAEFVLTRSNSGQVQVESFNVQVPSVQNTVAKQSVTTLVQDAHNRVRAHVNYSVATTPDEWNAERARLEDSAIVDIINEVQMQVTGAQLSAAAAFNTNARFGPGDITRRDLAMIYPFENMLYKMEITGSQLKSFLEHTSQYFLGVHENQPQINPGWPGYNFDAVSGVDYIIDISRPVGQRIVKLEYNGNAVQPGDVFTMAINSYRAEGGGGFDMLATAPVLWESDRAVRAYIEDYLKESGTISHESIFNQNWMLTW